MTTETVAVQPAAPARLPKLPGAAVLSVRAFRCWLLMYQRTWRASVWSSVFGPLFYLGAMGYGLGSLVDKNGTASLGGYRLHDDELGEGRYTFDMLVAATRRCMDAGVFRPGDPEAVAGQLWSAVHGFVMLELAGYLAADREPDAVDEVLNPMLTGIISALLA